MEWFDKHIRKPIKLFSHPVWFILQDEDVDCPCVNFVTKQADRECLKCLGTGNKIKLVRVKAAHQNNKISLRGTGLGFSEVDIVNVYYTFNKTTVKPGDMIVDGKDVDIVRDVYYEHSGEQNTVYYRIETAPYKDDKNKFIRRLNKLLMEAGY